MTNQELGIFALLFMATSAGGLMLMSAIIDYNTFVKRKLNKKLDENAELKKDILDRCKAILSRS